MTDYKDATKGKHGTVTNVTSGQKIAGVFEGTWNLYSFNFRIDNTVESNVFKFEDWTYEEDKLSIQEQFNALPIGAAFVEDEKWLERMPENFYVKTSEDRVLFVGPKTGSEQTKKFDPNEAGWKEIIRKEIA